MTREQHADAFAAHITSRLLPVLLERCGALPDRDTEAVVRRVIADAFLEQITPPGEAEHIVRDAFRAGFAPDDNDRV